MATSAVMRPNTANCRFLDSDTKVAEDFVIAPKFKGDLERYYKKASVEDQARCLELLTSLNIGEEVRAEAARETPPRCHPKAPRPQLRPKTAFTYTETHRDHLDQIRKTFKMDPYSTTYQREYTTFPEPPAVADRPATTQRAFQASYQLRGDIGGTTYQHEFYDKPQRKPPAIRTGSASGNRRNNPHPLETFMVWKLPRKTLAESKNSPWGRELTDDMMDQVCRGQLMSTYQQDYLGIPQGVQVQGKLIDAEDWRSGIPHPLETFTRRTYQKPDQQPELKGNTKRYGCNKLKETAAVGGVPTVSARMPQMNIKTRTTYECEYNEPYESMRPQEVRQIGKEMNIEALERYYHQAQLNQDQKEKEKLGRMMQAMNAQPPSSRPPSSASIRQ